MFAIDNNDNKFIQQLLKDCNRNTKLCKNAFLFKLDKGLIEMQTKLLPICAELGRCYLIKNNTIFEFYTCFSCETQSIVFTKSNIRRKSVVTVLNLNICDMKAFSNPDVFTHMDEMISYNWEKTLNFMKSLISSGFKLYQG